MVMKPNPMKVVCPQCQASQIFAPQSDALAFMPTCKKCHQTMQVEGNATLMDWIKSPTDLIDQVVRKKKF